jgi:signal transduction histidine kinase
MTRRLLGPVTGPVLFVMAAAAVFAVLGWVTHSALTVEQAQREAAARAELGSNLRVALWRLDGRMLPALGVEDGRPYYQYGPSDPNYGYGVATTPLLVTSLPDWMRLHFQLDADGWGSPQVLSPDVAERVREAWPDLPLRNVNPEREQVLQEIRRKFPARETLEALASRDHALPSDATVNLPVLSSGGSSTVPSPAPLAPSGGESLRKSTPSAPAPASTHSVAPPMEVKQHQISLFGIEICTTPDPAFRFAGNSPRQELDEVKKSDVQNQAQLRPVPPPPQAVGGANRRYQVPKDNENPNNASETISRADTITRGMKEVQPPPGAGQSKAQNALVNNSLTNSANNFAQLNNDNFKGQAPQGPAASAQQVIPALNGVVPQTARRPAGAAGAVDAGLKPGQAEGRDASNVASAAPAEPAASLAGAGRGGFAQSGRGSNASGAGIPGAPGMAIPPPTPQQGGVGGGFGSARPMASPQPGGPAPSELEGAAQAMKAADVKEKSDADKSLGRQLKQGAGAAPMANAPTASRPNDQAKDGRDRDREERSRAASNEASKRGDGPWPFFRSKEVDEDQKKPPAALYQAGDGEKKRTAGPNQKSESLAEEEQLKRDAQLQLGVPQVPAVPTVPLMPQPVPPPASANEVPLNDDVSTRNNLQTVPTPPQAIHLGSMRAQWIVGADGSQVLALVREARVDSRTVCQGIILDWAKLEAMLKDEVKDLFPNARLIPVTDPSTVSPEQAMSALPVQLDPGVQPEPPPAGWTTLRLGLALAWAAAITVFLTVGFCGWSLIDLAERRIRFVSAVTHELRTPLTSLRLYLDLLVSGMIQDEAKRQEYLNTLASESDRLHRLIDNVLDFARLEKRRTNRTIHPIRVAEILEHLRQAWMDRLAQEGHELVVISTLPAELEVRTDQAMVQQIVGNLIDNARKYARDAADRRIWVWARPAGANAIAVEVEDRGPGVPAGERRTIFKPFRRGSQAETAAGGAGLGLALAKSWAEVLGGRLSYRPADGGTGACFRLELQMK